MEEYSVLCNSVYKLHLQTAVTTRHQPPPPSSPQFQIKFKFSCNARFSFWTSSDQDSAETLLLEAQTPLMLTFVPLDLRRFLRRDKAQEIIHDTLKTWPVWGEAQAKLIDFALKKAREAVTAMPASHNCVHLHIHIAAGHKRVYQERRGSTTIIDWVIRQSMDVDGARMIPADDSSIKELEGRKVLILSSSETCCVCMEEFCGGCEAVCMPCAHVFHEDCIKKWLGTSHYCPVCRFEMPTI